MNMRVECISLLNIFCYLCRRYCRRWALPDSRSQRSQDTLHRRYSVCRRRALSDPRSQCSNYTLQLQNFISFYYDDRSENYFFAEASTISTSIPDTYLIDSLVDSLECYCYIFWLWASYCMALRSILCWACSLHMYTVHYDRGNTNDRNFGTQRQYNYLERHILFGMLIQNPFLLAWWSRIHQIHIDNIHQRSSFHRLCYLKWHYNDINK